MATAAATYTWSAEKAALKVRCGVATDDDSEDVQLERWFDEAVGRADDYAGHDWTDDSGADIPHAEGIRQGIYEYVRAAREYHLAAKGGLIQGGYDMSRPLGHVAFRAARPHWDSSSYGGAILGWGR